MGWVKIDDAFLDHPKFLRAGPLAGYLNLCAIAWSNRNLTDGFIPVEQVPRLVNWDGVAIVEWDAQDDIQPLELAKILERQGLWESVDGGWLIHDYLNHQASSASIRDKRKRDSERKAGAKGADRRSDGNGASGTAPTATTAGSSRPPNGFHAESARIPARKKEEGRNNCLSVIGGMSVTGSDEPPKGEKADLSMAGRTA